MDPTRLIAWDIYFGSITSLARFHPGSARDRAPLTIKECAEAADEMLAERDARFGPNGSAL